MDSDFQNTKLIGVVLDVSSRNLDLIKNALVEVIVKLGMNCKIYISDPKNYFFPRNQGQSVKMIAEHKLAQFDLEQAAKQAIFLLSEEDGDKYLLIITDNYKKELKYRYFKGAMINRTKDYGCKICILNLDAKDATLEQDAAENLCEYRHIKPNLLVEQINEIIL